MIADLTGQAEVLAEGLVFGEGPRWRDGHLVFSDIHAHRVLSLDQTGGPDDGTLSTVATFDGACSGLGWLPDGTLLVSSMDDRRVLRVEGGVVVEWADLSGITEFGINDMVVAADGHAYVGQFGYDFHGGGRPGLAPLLIVDPLGRPRLGPPDLMVANGIAITSDGSTLVVAESGACRLTAFTLVDGEPVDRRVYAELPPKGYPDGICLDAEGAVWVACPILDSFVRVLPGGEVTHVIRMLIGRHAIACVLGGEDRHTLYMCTASTLGGAGESRAAMDAQIERITVDVPGAGIP